MNARLRNFQVVTGYQLVYRKTCRLHEICNFPRISLLDCEVFVHGIPFDALEDELIPFFSTVGTVVKFKLLTFDDCVYNKGFAIVTYSDSKAAETAVNLLNFVHFRERLLYIEKVTGNCRLFVGGIPETKTKDQVWQALLRSGINEIVDVIMYRSYRNRSFNRGYVFVEFPSYLEAAQVRILHRNLFLWGEKVSIDWSEPIPSVTDDVMSKVKKLFIRNIEVTMSKNSFESIIKDILGDIHLEKVYKFKDYAFIHFRRRGEAQTALELLKDTFKSSFVEVSWATPQEYAPKKKNCLKNCNSKKSSKRQRVLCALQEYSASDKLVKCQKEVCTGENDILDTLETKVTDLLNSLGLD
ncbi:hypothetical protein Trydic_g17134 [Trypoxylus dichotomus]